jgi:hypothetical protein
VKCGPRKRSKRRTGEPGCGVAGELAPRVPEHELGEFGRGRGVHAAARVLDGIKDGAEPFRGDVEEPARNRQAFLLVRGEQAWRGVAGEYEAQLPAKVVGVLDPAVHAEATCDGVYVRGVPGEEHPAHLELVDHTDVDPVGRAPRQTAQSHVWDTGDPVEGLLESLQRRF